MFRVKVMKVRPWWAPCRHRQHMPTWLIRVTRRRLNRLTSGRTASWTPSSRGGSGTWDRARDVRCTRRTAITASRGKLRTTRNCARPLRLSSRPGLPSTLEATGCSWSTWKAMTSRAGSSFKLKDARKLHWKHSYLKRVILSLTVLPGPHDAQGCVRCRQDSPRLASSSSSRNAWWPSTATGRASTRTPSGSLTAVSVASGPLPDQRKCRWYIYYLAARGRLASFVHLRLNSFWNSCLRTHKSHVEAPVVDKSRNTIYNHTFQGGYLFDCFNYTHITLTNLEKKSWSGITKYKTDIN